MAVNNTTDLCVAYRVVNQQGVVLFENDSQCVDWGGPTVSITQNCTMDEADDEGKSFEKIVAIVVPVIFGLIALTGFLGNLLVIVVVWCNKQMRNTTNLLIINLAIADLFFIIICVPFTATIFAVPVWPFGTAWCKIYQFMINVTAYASVYTLVFMSLDRYLAVVHPISSMTIRTERNAWIVILVSWSIILLGNVHVLIAYEEVPYPFNCEIRTTCMNDPAQGPVFYSCFFTFAFVLPVCGMCVLYGFMVKRLMYGVVPGGSQSAESLRSKKRVTRMVVIVVVIFVICWTPIQIILLCVYVLDSYPETGLALGFQIASNCLAYMNSCVNPFLYAFLSDYFRKSFKKLLCCYGPFKPVKVKIERTTAARPPEPVTRTTAMNNNSHAV